MLRKRLNQEWVRSTAQRRTFCPGFFFLAAFLATRAAMGREAIRLEDGTGLLVVSNCPSRRCAWRGDSDGLSS